MDKQIDFMRHLRTFCAHFSGYANKVNSITGHHTRHLSDETYRYFTSRYNLPSNERMKGEELNDFISKIFAEFREFPIIDMELHLDKMNNSIVDFILAILYKFENGKRLDNQTVTNLHVVHSSLLNPFTQLSQTSRNTTGEHAGSASPDETIISWFEKQDFCKTLHFKVNKLLRYRHHCKLVEIYRRRDSTPSSLYYNRFPRPFFCDDEAFIDKHNKIVKKCQEEFMMLISETLDSKLVAIENEINELENETTLASALVKHKLDFKLVCAAVLESEGDYLEEWIQKMTNRAERSESRPFMVFTKERQLNSTTALTDISNMGTSSQIDNINTSGSESNVSRSILKSANKGTSSYDQRRHNGGFRGHKGRTHGDSRNKNADRSDRNQTRKGSSGDANKSVRFSKSNGSSFPKSNSGKKS